MTSDGFDGTNFDDMFATCSLAELSPYVSMWSVYAVRILALAVDLCTFTYAMKCGSDYGWMNETLALEDTLEFIEATKRRLKLVELAW